MQLHIAPWALPKENIPIHVQWKPELEFQTVRIDIPEGFTFTEFVNLNKVQIDNRSATIERSQIVRGDASSYFGSVVRYDQIPNATASEGRVVVSFLSQGHTSYSREITARIFRPHLDFINPPKSIELKDNSKIRLPLYLKYTGFGDIQLRLEATIGGSLVSEGGSVAFEILRRLWLYEISEKEEDAQRQQKKHKITVEPEYVKEIANEVQKILDSGEIPAEAFDKEALVEIKKWLLDQRAKDKFMDLFYSRIEDMLLSLLVDLLESHPASNVRLVDPRAKILTRIKAPVEKLVLRLRYSDLMDNDYQEEVPIDIVDKRTGGESVLDMPIVIEKWDDNPLLNVAGV